MQHFSVQQNGSMIDVGGVVLDGGALTVGAGITPPDGGIGVGVAVAGAEGGLGAPMSAAAYAAAAVCLFFIGFFGFFTNLVVIVLMCREKQLWTPLNVILFNLVLSDFSVSILGNPFTLASALAHRWLFGRLMCIVYGFFMSLLGISSITTLTVLSFERYLMISKPFRGKHLNHKGSAFLVISIWIYSLALTTPPLFGWGEYINESANISCSVNWETSNYNHTTYIVYLFAMGLFVPASVICYSYLNIIRSMKKNVRVGGHVTKAEKKVAMMVAIMIVAFFFAWTPYAILALLIAFADAQVAPWLSVVPALMAKSSICYNPIIYVVLNTQFRSAWRRLLGVTVSLETSGEVVGTLASPAHNVSYSVNHQLPPSRTTRTTTTDHHLPPSTLVVHLDTTTDPTKMASSVLCKPPNNNSRSFYFFHQQQQKTPKKKKRRAKFVASAASTCCRDGETCMNDREAAASCNVRETCGNVRETCSNEVGLELKDMSARTSKVMTLQLKKASSENSVLSK